jgi:endonuclease/exonuclease/phosphatase family metal-dependent hydrolase
MRAAGSALAGPVSRVESEVRLRVVTYNIHRGRGLDGRNRLGRIERVLREIDADIIALQEVLEAQVPVLAAETGMVVVFGPTRAHAHGLYGNVCLSRVPLVGHHSYSLTCRPFGPRGCLRADLAHHRAGPLHLFNVHLGLRAHERVRQVRLLEAILDRQRLVGPRILVGDFNEWFSGRASQLLHAEFGHPCGRQRAVRTHPSMLPVFPLDRIYSDPVVRVVRVAVHRSRTALVASDHLPAYADLCLKRVA